MRYWVYINDRVIEMPFEEGELSVIKGFNGNTLICKETPAPGEAQEWMPAKMLIEAYKQPVPPPPPPPQIIAKFAQQEAPAPAAKESKSTILSGNIFGDSRENNNIPVGNDTPYTSVDTTKSNIGQTEVLSAQEQESLSETEKLKEELFNDSPVEIVSIDEVEEIDVDKHASDSIESEEEILKTAIKTLVSSKPIKKEEEKLHAIDIAHNTNIDLSDQEETDENKTEEPKQDSMQAELKPLGEGKTGINHLFDIDEKEPEISQAKPEEDNTQEQPVENPIKEEKEEEFEPEEEISLDEDSSGIIAETEPQKEKTPEENKPEEKAIEENFVTSPALIAEEQETQAKADEENQTLPESENILEPVLEPEEKLPTTLDELTGRYPLEQEDASTKTPEEQTPKENASPEPAFIPSEIHPDVIVEEIKQEEDKKEIKPEIQEQQATQQLDKDNFLTTFSSDIETVFLDQPTAFISDYIPPEETKEEDDNLPEEIPSSKEESKSEILDIKSSQGQQQVSLQNVRRVKPAAIKTVPMVEGQQVDPFSQTQIRDIRIAEEAMAKVERNANIVNILKTFGLIGIFLFMIVAFVALIAQIGILPKDFSPLHAMLKGSTKEEKVTNTNRKLSPEEIALNDLKEAEELRINKIISEVKNYKLSEGITLEEKIKLMHPGDFGKLEWAASQFPTDLTYYSVTVSSPTNPEGYTPVNYRFNYNTVTYSVEATTSEANNLMIKPYQAQTAQQTGQQGPQIQP